MSQFMFATGIENSYPTIEWKGKTIRQDELAKTKHYERWRDDFRLLQELEIEYLRYGPPYFSTHTGPGQYDWSFTDETFRALHDLCQANVMAMHAILKERPDAIFIQSESTQYFHPEGPDCEDAARRFNEKRFLSFDLTYGHHVNATIYEYLLDNGMTRDVYH